MLTTTLNGTWTMMEDVSGRLCELQCNTGFVSTGCHLLRQNVGWRWLLSTWNNSIPECEPEPEESWHPWFLFFGICVALILLLGFVILPAVIAFLGFGAAGITAFSFLGLLGYRRPLQLQGAYSQLYKVQGWLDFLSIPNSL
ncbi:uncharacterized protein LOC125665807 isoform X2 [Ostrea edulis]|uniref:uncharacterized protein LOC125665807 isoform X2 n=1 Tax=Ostrea edulis TaxID=37623 RepID=UPI0024AE8E43|nr:uncharacterized protein LOC125665807 isoform X2 [Ostrea edulis]XP_048754647.2 uncharacterized protein LOC125665807 isoform X2 [Ostrea edulis]XP_056006965.1 uncharacterized protein LOC125665807 isoform X2 [Ostrea edulis]